MKSWVFPTETVFMVQSPEAERNSKETIETIDPFSQQTLRLVIIGKTDISCSGLSVSESAGDEVLRTFTYILLHTLLQVEVLN